MFFYFKLILILTIITPFVITQEKPGSCPNNLNVKICSSLCTSDFGCSGNSKCCKTLCGGSICVSPIGNESQNGEKFGSCPIPSGPWVCSSRCGSDSDCRGKKKCCKNRCGAMACFNPDLPQIQAPPL
ncbi:waprin-Phi1-like [Onthophagus taurus]|uniref:waprin-Phi1-like n=1 Tax=Onthophagus taurus TaxID=166361 RepID=UPI000C20E065|nr:waprin-Phi1-like [Onthophagus taurus]